MTTQLRHVCYVCKKEVPANHFVAEDGRILCEEHSKGVKPFVKPNNSYFRIDPECGLMKKIEVFIKAWDAALTNNYAEEKIEKMLQHYCEMWKLAQSALKEVTGLDFHFSRTDSHYGICTDDGEFLMKFGKERSVTNSNRSSQRKVEKISKKSSESDFILDINYTL